MKRIPFKLRVRFLWWHLRYGTKRAQAMIFQRGYEAGFPKGFDRGFADRHGIDWEDKP